MERTARTVRGGPPHWPAALSFAPASRGNPSLGPRRTAARTGHVSPQERSSEEVRQHCTGSSGPSGARQSASAASTHCASPLPDSPTASSRRPTRRRRRQRRPAPVVRGPGGRRGPAGRPRPSPVVTTDGPTVSRRDGSPVSRRRERSGHQRSDARDRCTGARWRGHRRTCAGPPQARRQVGRRERATEEPSLPAAAAQLHQPAAHRLSLHALGQHGQAHPRAEGDRGGDHVLADGVTDQPRHQLAVGDDPQRGR